MPSPTQIGTAGLQGWRVKAADAVAEPLARRSPLDVDQVRAAMGALFFVLALTYLIKTVTVATRAARDG